MATLDLIALQSSRGRMRAHGPKTCRARYRSRLCIRALEANGPRGGRPEFRFLAGSRAGREGNGSGREAGDNFFRLANGRWLQSTEIPPDRSSWSHGPKLTELTAEGTAGLIQG